MRQSDNVIFENGAGFLSDFENIVCITDEWIRFDGFLETEDSVMDSIDEYYPDEDSFPCSDVTVFCGNATVHKSCSMIHETTLDPISALFDDDEDVCTLINVQDLHTVSCHGECPSSPTSAPTVAPTDSPTASPSRSPSETPTNSPTAMPSVSPTTDPTPSPSQSPTQFPTVTNPHDYYIEMQYEIGQLSDDHYLWISDSVNGFAQNLSAMIVAGFAADDFIEYRFIAVNVTKFNNEKIDDLEEGSYLERYGICTV